MLLQFQKGDIVRHLGLLDLQRTMQRALRRSGLPIAYSNGFNPHIVMSFASALSSGIPGDAELLDVSLKGEATAEECMAAMNRVLPPALQVSRVRMVDDRFPKVSAALRQAEYTITLRGGGACAIASALPAFLAQDALTARTDEEKNTAVLTARVSFVEAATLKPDLLVESLCTFAGAQPERCEIRRTCLLGEKDGQSVPLIDL